MFFGVLPLQGETKLPKTSDYWNGVVDKAINMSILKAMSKEHWHQIKRYLKVSNPLTDLDSAGPQWYTKLKPLYTDIVAVSHQFPIPGRNVSVDEQLILFKGRS